MKVSGKTIFSMAMGKRAGLICHFMRENTSLEKNTGVASTAGMTDHAMMVNGKKTKLKGSAPTHGSMDASTRENGLITIWTESAYTHGRTVESIAVSIRTIKNRAMASTLGRTVVSTRDTGGAANNMGSAATKCLASRSSLASGKRASALSGSMRKPNIKLKMGG